MKRREFLQSAILAAGPGAVPPPLIIPVQRVMDRRTQCTPAEFHRFWWITWPEAVRDFNRSGIKLQCHDTTGEIRRTAAERPVFPGLQHGVLNLVLTDHIPMFWDHGRALAGVATLQDGCCVIVIALRYAHPHHVPFLSTNTCVHEILHALLQDIFVQRPGQFQVGERETRIDWYATKLWLSHDGGTIRASASACLRRLQGHDFGG